MVGSDSQRRLATYLDYASLKRRIKKTLRSLDRMNHETSKVRKAKREAIWLARRADLES